MMSVNLIKARNAVLMNGHEQMKYNDILKEDPGESDDFELISIWIVRNYISEISLRFPV